MIISKPSSKDSEEQRSARVKKALVGLAAMSHTNVKSLKQMVVFSKDVAAAHDEVLKHGSPEQIKRIDALFEGGTAHFRLAVTDRQRLHESAGRFRMPEP